jgi:hypothetical protein
VRAAYPPIYRPRALSRRCSGRCPALPARWTARRAGISCPRSESASPAAGRTSKGKRGGTPHRVPPLATTHRCLGIRRGFPRNLLVSGMFHRSTGFFSSLLMRIPMASPQPSRAEAGLSSGMAWIGMTRNLQLVGVSRRPFLLSWDPSWTELRLRDVVFRRRLRRLFV